MRRRHGFHTVRNEFAAGEGELHSLMTHCDAVADRDGVEFKGDAARFADLVTDIFADLVEVAVPGDNRGVGVAYADERLGKISFFQTRRSEQSSVRSSLDAALHDVTSHFLPFNMASMVEILP